MYTNVSDIYKALAEQNDRFVSARLVNSSNASDVLEDCIVNVSLNQNANSSDDELGLGGTVSSYIDVQFNGLASGYLINGKEYILYIGLGYLDNTTSSTTDSDGDIVYEEPTVVYEYAPMGYFTAQKPTYTDSNNGSFVAYDRFYSALNGTYSSDLTYPASSASVLREIQTKSGITINGISSLRTVTIPLKTVTSDEGTATTEKPFAGMTYRDSIGCIASMLGKFATINRSGEVELRWYNTVDYKVELDLVIDDITSSNEAFTVNRIACTVNSDENNVVTSPSGSTDTYAINFGCPVMTQAILDLVYADVGGFSYTPYQAKYIGNPLLDLGDIITLQVGVEIEEVETIEDDGTIVYTENIISETDVQVPLMSIIHSFDGSYTQEFGSYAYDEQTSGDYTQSPISDRLSSYYADTLTLKTLIADKVSTKYLEANYAHITDGIIDEAQIGKLSADHIDTDSVVTRVLESETLQANYAHISNGVIDNATINGKNITNSTLFARALSDDMVITGLGVAVIYSGETPSTRKDGSALQAGDFWYKTVDDADFDPLTGVISRWTLQSDGTYAWEADELSEKESIFRANSIVAQDISAHTITATQCDMESLQTNLEYVGDLTKDHLEITDTGIKVMYAQYIYGAFGSYLTDVTE